MKTVHPTHEIVSTVRSFTRACAAVLAVVLSAAPCARAATDATDAAALRSNLPAGVTLLRASIAQTVSALHETVLQHHDEAVDLLRIAVLAKTPKQGDGKLACDDLRKLLQAATTAAPDRTRELAEMAATLDPDCADSLQDLLAGGDALGAADAAGGDGGFGAGLGSGFPGAPGFVGSAPSGTFAFPPVVAPAVTSVINP